MQKFQQLIAQAFSKIDASNPQMRQKIYENIWVIQEKSLIAHNVPESIKQEKRRQLTDLLKNVELQYHQAAQRNAPPPSAETYAPDGREIGSSHYQDRSLQQQYQPSSSLLFPEENAGFPQAQRPAGNQQMQWEDSVPNIDLDDARPSDPQRRSAHGAYSGQRRDSYGRFTANDLAASPSADFLPSADEKFYKNSTKKNGKKRAAPRKKRSIIRYIFILLSLSVVAFFVWTVYISFGLPGSKPNSGSTAPWKQNDERKGGWIEIPLNADNMVRQGAATIDLHDEPDAAFIRITSHKSGDAAIMEIGQGALMSLRGKKADFKLVARNATNADAGKSDDNNSIGQLNLSVDFGNGETKSYSFELPPTKEPRIFQMDIPEKIRQNAKLYIGGDLEKGSEQIDIFALLLRSSDKAQN